MKHTYEQKLLEDWEEIFRQGLLTFWVFIALSHDHLTVDEIAYRVAQLTKDTYQPATQTLYRLLRKHNDLELVDFQEVPGNGGPNKKVYCLSKLGHTLLAQFTNRNISLFDQSIVKELIRKDIS